MIQRVPKCIAAILWIGLFEVAYAQTPEITELSLVVLREPTGLQLAKPLSARVSNQGTLFVADGFHDGVLEFDRAGVARRWIGRLQKTAGRPSALGGIVYATNDEIATYDYARDELLTYDLATGQLMRRQPYSGRLVDGAFVHDTAWLIMPNYQLGTSVAHFSSRVTGKDTIKPSLLPIVSSYRQSDRLASVFDLAFIEVFADTLVVAYGGTAEVVFSDRTGSVRRGIRIPSGGNPYLTRPLWDLLVRDELQFAELVSSVAPIRLFRRLPDGVFVAVYVELERAADRTLATGAWVSLLSHDGLQACTGGRIPLRGSAQPAFAVRGDTLTVVQRQVVDHAARSIRTEYKVSPRGCEWRATSTLLGES